MRESLFYIRVAFGKMINLKPLWTNKSEHFFHQPLAHAHYLLKMQNLKKNKAYPNSNTPLRGTLNWEIFDLLTVS